jgi:hypothetical protein
MCWGESLRKEAGFVPLDDFGIIPAARDSYSLEVISVDGSELAASIVTGEGGKIASHLAKLLLEPTFKAAGEWLAVPVEMRRDKRRLRATKVVEESARQLQQSGDEPKAIPERMLIPLLEKASLVEEEELQHVWSSLLANMARNPEGVLPAFVGILGELSPIEVRLLASWAQGSSDVKILANYHHTNEESLKVVGDLSELRLILTNMERLMLIVPSQHASEFDKHGDETFIGLFVRLTRFGARFILACSAKR